MLASEMALAKTTRTRRKEHLLPSIGKRKTPPDLRFLEVDGRRWRRSDPRIPASLRQQVVDELMSARRAVAAAADDADRRSARRRVHDAKIALGERGRPWWSKPSGADVALRIDAAIRALLRSRRDGATICPSEPARIVDGESWRRLLPTVRERAVRLAGAGDVVILRGGAPARDRPTKGVLRYRLAGAGRDLKKGSASKS